MPLPSSFHARSPEEFREEILSLPVTDEPLPPAPGEELTEDEMYLVTYLLENRFPSLPMAVRALRPLIRKYPRNPSLKFHLYTANITASNDRKAKQLLDEITEAFPEYLFGRTAQAFSLLRENRMDEALALMGGESLSIRSLLPDREILHIAEVTTYYERAALILARAAHSDAAMAVITALDERGIQILPEFSKIVQELATLMELQSPQANFVEDRKRGVSVEIPPIRERYKSIKDIETE